MSVPAAGRRCTRTGLNLVPVTTGPTYRIAKPQYGALSAPPRSPGTDAASWGRFDSPGRTLYTARDRVTAFAEVLSAFKRQIGQANPLAADAAALGLSLDDFLEAVAADWQERSFMGVGAIPKRWRDVRLVYEISSTGDGWWIDVEHPDSVSVLESELEPLLAARGIRMLTTAVIRGEDREVTTAIGTALREKILDDGSPARGLQFGSKFGGGWCRAIWLPDDPTASTELIALSGEPVLVSDRDLTLAADRFGIRVF